MRLPRWIHCAYAAVAGYGWLPCPLCGREFGGHEATGASIPKPGRPGVGLLICPRCAPDDGGYTVTRWHPASLPGSAPEPGDNT